MTVVTIVLLGGGLLAAGFLLGVVRDIAELRRRRVTFERWGRQ